MKIIGAVNLGWHMLCTCYAHAMQCICYMSASDRSASLFEAWALHLLEEMEVNGCKDLQNLRLSEDQMVGLLMLISLN